MRKKVEMEEHLNSIICDVACLNKDFHIDASSLTEDLNTLLSSFCTSEYDSKVMTEMEELLKSLEWRRPQIDTLLSVLVGQNDPIAVQDGKILDSNAEEEDVKTEDHNVEDGGRKIKDHNVEVEGRKTEDHNVEEEGIKTEDQNVQYEGRKTEGSSRGKGKKKKTKKGRGKRK